MAEEIAQLTVRIAQENPSWRYTTIMGALPNVGHVVARETVRNILKEHGIGPAPERSKRIPWSTFLKSHWDCIAATDLFTVEVWSCVGLIRYYVLFFIRLWNRSVHIAGITPQPHGGWIKQIARNVTDPIDGFLLGARYLIMDRDKIFTKEFRSFLRQEGIKAVRLPPRSPNLNAHAERFVRTIKETCLNRMIFFGEDSLFRAITEFTAYYHHERNHQGLENRLIDPQEEIGAIDGPIVCRERLGGLLNYYYREAA
ncbi:MAG: transposase [Phycisphaerales bacterium]|nr:MAG: transposase [Phycisphaerales bacterium]